MKHTIKISLAALILLLGISCKKESVSTLSASIKNEDNAAIKTGGHYIGEHYGGGIIIWITPNGLRGLIADTVDLGEAAWSPWETDTTTGATGTAIGTGKLNTKKIVLSHGRIYSYAALKCVRYKGSGYTDWFLPSKDELNELYKHKSLFGSFGFKIYWSSSESNINHAWDQYFASGSQYSYYKSSAYYVRAFRAYE